MRMPSPAHLLTVAAASALLLSACGSADKSGGTATAAKAEPAGKVTVQHAQGSTEVPRNPQRIAVLDYGILDSVDALGGKIVAVPQSSPIPAFLEKYKSKDFTNIGTLQKPDVEKLAAAQPDLILIGNRSASTYKDLSGIAPTLDLTIDGTAVVTSFKERTRALGTVLGQEQQVEKRLGEIDATIARVKQKATGSGNGLILMTSGGKVSAFGASSRFGLIHDDLGIPQAVSDLSKDRHGQAVSFEFIAEKAPQRLFVVDRDAAIGTSGKAAAQVLDNALVAGTPAWKDKKVTYLDGVRWYVAGSGLNNLPAMIAEVEAGLG